MNKKFVFYLITLLVPLVFFLLLEFGLKFFGFGERAPEAFITDSIDKSYLVLNPSIAKRYFTSQEFAPTGAYDVFKKVKTDSTFRIFVQGASSSAGFPFRATSFPRLLEQKLQSSYPQLDVEVVNTSLVATNSFTILDLSEDIIAQQPDLVIIYGGHNEFYGALGVGSSQSLGRSPLITNLYLKLKNVRTVQLMKNFVKTFYNQSMSDKDKPTLMAKMVREESISLNSKIYRAGLKQFEFNISRAIEKYKSNGIPVFLSSLVSNLKNFPPFESSKDQLSANAFYEKGQNLLLLGEYNEAKQALTMARDADLLKFRATSEILAIIDSICIEKGIPKIDMEAAFTEASPFGIIGEEFLVEHVHANLDGQRLFAETSFKTVDGYLKSKGYRPIQNTEFEYVVAAIDSSLGYQMINQLLDDWPFVDEPIEGVSRSKFLDQLMTGELSWFQVLFESFYQNIKVNPSEALRVAKVMQQEFPHQKQPYYFIVEALIGLNQFEKAHDAINAIPDKLKGIESLELQLRLNLLTFDYKNAMVVVNELVRLKPNNYFNKMDESLKLILSTNYRDYNKADIMNNQEKYVAILEALIFVENMSEGKELNENLLKLIPQNEGLKRVNRRGVF